MNIRKSSVPTQQHIKSMHLKEIFLAALHSGGISRAHLKQELHLSFPSVSALVDELLSHSILMEAGAQSIPERGRPRTLLRVNPQALAIPVLALTRAGYHYALYDCTANCLEEGFLPFAPNAQAGVSPNEFWHSSVETLCGPLKIWSRRISQVYRIADLLLVVPGTINKTHGLSSSALRMSAPNTFLPCLEATTGWNIVVQNNSDCCAYAEKVCRPLSEDFIYIYIENGVGAGIIRGGKVFQSQGPRAGEIGHISIHYGGRECSCGRKGCLESYISTVAITQDAQTLSPSISTFEDVCAAYAAGSAEITPLLREKALLLSVGIHNVLTMQPVSHVILGGSVGLLGPGFLDLVQNFLQSTCWDEASDHVTISYAKTTSGSESLGAVWNYLGHLMEIDRIFPQ